MAIIDDIYNRIDSKIDIQVNLFNSEIVNVLNKVESLAIIRLKDLNINNVIEYDLIWRGILDDAGYYQIVNDYINAGYDTTYKDINAFYAEVGLATALSSDDISNINAIKRIDMQYFTKLGDDVGLVLKQRLTNYVVGGMSAEQMAIQIKRDLIDTDLAKYSKTYAQTSISKFNQSVINMKSAEIDDKVWIYLGVNDDITRDYCKCILNQNKYYDDNSKLKLENDSRRKYNCRHLFFAVSREYAIYHGYIDGGATC